MSETTKETLESILPQLKCHFTWNLVKEEESIDKFENRVLSNFEFQNNKFKATACNILAYIQHRKGQHNEALKCLAQAEDFIKQEHAAQVEIRSLVTWGNYAWVHYHMGQYSKAQEYVDKVRQICEKLHNPYRIESPVLDCEEGWAQLKCTRNQNEWAKVCFEKALEKNPKNAEFTCGWAISKYRLDYWPASQDPTEPLNQAMNLNPNNQYVKVLMALKLQKMHEEHEGSSLVEEALRKAPDAIDVLHGAAKFYQKKGALDKAISLLKKALEHQPSNALLHYNIGCCYRSKVLQTTTMRENGVDRRRETWELESMQQAVDHLKKAEELNGTLFSVCSYIANFCSRLNRNEEADFYFQKEFTKELSPEAKQLLHLRYGNFMLFNKKNCEDKAIHQFMEGVKIQKESKEREKMRVKLHKIATKQLFRNVSDSEAQRILMFLQESSSQREMHVRNHLPSASFHETWNED